MRDKRKFMILRKKDFFKGPKKLKNVKSAKLQRIPVEFLIKLTEIKLNEGRR